MRGHDMIPRLLVAMLALAAVAGVHAQSNYPSKPMRWIIPYAAGGGTDAIARPIALKLGEALGQTIVYENVGGGGGLLAAQMVARAAPDGYTFLVAAPNTHIFATLLNQKISFDPVKDFAPITKFDTTPNILVANPKFPPNNLRELVAYAKANPGKVNFASSGSGSGGHLAIVLMNDELNIKMLHVPYKGAGPAVTGTLAGENDLIFVNPAVVMSNVKAGRLKPLGFAGPKRLRTLPDLPTFDEQGYPGYESNNFKGLMAPAGTPRPIIDKQHAALVKIIHSPDIAARLTAAGSIPRGTTPEEFAEENRLEVAKWAKVIKKHGITAN